MKSAFWDHYTLSVSFTALEISIKLQVNVDGNIVITKHIFNKNVRNQHTKIVIIANVYLRKMKNGTHKYLFCYIV
jgi:hypothetical protein